MTESETRRRLGLVLALVVLVVMAITLVAALPAQADHVSDGGIDEPWVEAMNQETYWEARFGGECTKFSDHSGFIPASYEAGVVKDGNMVRVYNPAPDDAVMLGAVNPANGQHFAAPHSWVMKCDVIPQVPVAAPTLFLQPGCGVPESITIPTFENLSVTFNGVNVEGQTLEGPLSGELVATLDAGFAFGVVATGWTGEGATRSFPFELAGAVACETTTTTSTTIQDTTTTTIADTTTTTGDSTTTTIADSTTTTAPNGSTLPFTGSDNGLMVGLGASALALGALLVFAVRREEDGA